METGTATKNGNQGQDLLCAFLSRKYLSVTDDGVRACACVRVRAFTNLYVGMDG